MHDWDIRDYQLGDYQAAESFFPATVHGHSVFGITFNDAWGDNFLSDGSLKGCGTAGLAYSSSGLVLYEIDSSWGSLPFTTPVTILTDQMLSSGGTYRFSTHGTYDGTTLNVSITVIISNSGTVSVPAGTYEDCKRVVMLLSTSIAGITFSAYDAAGWVLAPDIGIIKDQSLAYYPGVTGTPGIVDEAELVWGLISNNRIPASNVSPFVGSHGIYNGLFYNGGGVTEETAGMLKGLNLGTLGTYSATLLIAGKSYGISGGFDFFGFASNRIPRAVNLGGPLTVEMTLNWNVTPPLITGTVTGTNGGYWVANLFAKRAANNGSAEYTTVLSPISSGPNLPPGYGYVLMTNHLGVFTLSGALADGTSLTATSQTVPVSENGDIPVYDSLYGNTGLLLGWVNIANGVPAGNLEWIKKASHATALYTNGFTNFVSAQGSLWANPLAHTAAVDLPAGHLNISGGSMLSALSFNVAVSNNNALAKLPGGATNSLAGSINPKNGLLTVTFGNGTGKATTVGTGAVLQNGANAGGFFLSRTNAGSIILQP
jgi:hypothetical protein